MCSKKIIWNQLKEKLNPSEVEYYASKIGRSRITRNEDALQEHESLINIIYITKANIENEIKKIDPPFMSTQQRNIAVDKAINYLDEFRNNNQFIEIENKSDSQIILYLKYIKMIKHGNEDSKLIDIILNETKISEIFIKDTKESIEKIQNSIDDEYNQIQNEISQIRKLLLDYCGQLDEIKTIVFPSLEALNEFNKRIQTRNIVLKHMERVNSSHMKRMQSFSKMNEFWR